MQSVALQETVPLSQSPQLQLRNQRRLAQRLQVVEEMAEGRCEVEDIQCWVCGERDGRSTKLGIILRLSV